VFSVQRFVSECTRETHEASLPLLALSLKFDDFAQRLVAYSEDPQDYKVAYSHKRPVRLQGIADIGWLSDYSPRLRNGWVAAAIGESMQSNLFCVNLWTDRRECNVPTNPSCLIPQEIMR